MIKVLIVEDSIVARELLARILSSDSEINVIGTATNGEEAVEFVARTKPDAVTMDIIMPKMDGFEATRRIMETRPVPIVIVSSSLNKEEVEKTWRAVEAGAVAILEKPRYSPSGHLAEDAVKLIQTVKLMSQVKVVRRWTKHKLPEKVKPAPAEEVVPSASPRITPGKRVVAIGASTGGPAVLHNILRELPAGFPVPILVVQHITRGFTVGFVDWLNQACELRVGLAVNNEIAQPGNVYVAPDGFQMKIDARSRIALTNDEPENGLRPSVSCLFRSVAHAFRDKAVGILLTGMGRDGAEDLKLMMDKGAVTIAQDEESSIVYGMPQEAARLGAARYSLPPEKITQMLKSLIK